MPITQIVDKKVKFKLKNLNGPNGNAFFILGDFSQAASKAGWTDEETKAVVNEATNGDYIYLLAVIQAHCE